MKHGTIKKLNHKKHIVPYNKKEKMEMWDEEYVTDEDCDGTVRWDEGLEGFVCSKCDLYTGSK